MSYIEKNLMDGEHIFYRTRLHKVVFTKAIIWFLFVVILFGLSRDAEFAAKLAGGRFLLFVAGFFLLIAIIKAIESLVKYSSSEFGVTNQRVLLKTGFIRRRSLEVLLSKVEAIQVNQDILGRILGYGSIMVSGTGGTRDIFYKIANPLEFRKKIQEQVAAIQNR